ncbi:YkgJ family cysteine cluster protein [Candidatus Woesearchaeota archaeon]|nr:YkgJ family cysteine cluster protein [Candidatus Woesearchaeota archaeon]
MVKEVLVDENTRWECIFCGKCCYKIGNEFSLRLFNEKTKEGGKCVNLNEKNRCNIYDCRPLGCKMYPFYPDWNKIKVGIVDFSIGSLKIDEECSGYMKGVLVTENKKLFKKLGIIALQIKENIKKLKHGQIKDIFALR